MLQCRNHNVVSHNSLSQQASSRSAARGMRRVPLCLLRLPLLMSTMLLLVCRRTMASHAAAAGTRYAVRLKPPMQGSVLAVRSPDAKASATSSYEVVPKPQEDFNGMQVGRRVAQQQRYTRYPVYWAW